MSRNRAAKKTSKRGHVPTAVMQPGQTEWIPGVPAFHQGTHPNDPAFIAAHEALFPGESTTDGTDFSAYEGIPDDVLLTMALGGDQGAIAILTIKGKWGFGGSGGSGGTSIDPAQQQFMNDLLKRDQALDEKIADINEQLAANQIDATDAINRRNVAAAADIEDKRRFMEALQLKYTQQRDELDREIQTFQTNLGARGQDITQRGQDISGALDASGQQLQGLTQSGQQLGNLAGLEQSRQTALREDLRDPRNFAQLMRQFGGGNTFLDQIAAGQPISGQSATTGLAGLTDSDNTYLNAARAELGQTPLFDLATQRSNELGDFQGPSLPGQVAGLGPEAVLTPDEQVIFKQFMAAAPPGTPIDIGIDAARNPANFRLLFERMGIEIPTQQPAPVSTTPSVPPGAEGALALHQRLVGGGLMSTGEFAAWLNGGADPMALWTMLVQGGKMSSTDFATIVSLIPQNTAAGGTGNVAGVPVAPTSQSLSQQPAPLAGTNPQQAAMDAFFRSGGDQQSFQATGPTLDIFATPTSGAFGRPENESVRSAFERGAVAPWLSTGSKGVKNWLDKRIAEIAAAPYYTRPNYFGTGGSGTLQSSMIKLQAIYDNIQAQTGVTRDQIEPIVLDRVLQQWKTSPVPAYAQDAAARATGVTPEGQAIFGSTSGATAGSLQSPTTALQPTTTFQTPQTALQAPLTSIPATPALAPTTELLEPLGTQPAGIGSFAQGGGILVDEPTIAIGMISGEEKFTLGEPTSQYPQGIPELVSPSGNGIQITPPSFALGGNILTGIGGNIVSGGGFSPDPAALAQITAPQPLVPQPEIAEPIGPPATQFGTGVTPQTPGGTDAPSVEPTAIQDNSPGAFLRNLFSLNAQSYNNLTPSQQDILFSIGRSFGVPEADARFSIERSQPRGLDPSRVLTPGFARGGYVRVA